ncbi:hypothetical protein C3432_13855 [Citrobacter amalonaticus]|uniref:Uncharacterized protein n=1 Tax=Citrobacter amalonaticus TaxID=35703 RepID=A0A2S4RW83_CITAM|nr:hypothetical protein C3432_13855 [Citrobacter amalonaticus]POT75025.1 hypothetical protein C3436_14325 [Citrobacter amalonaticus]POU64554.1 hypothetical protein C3430_15345 [Citrobacter amalonaticus]POV04390.1 hypothetical protein C3424_14665 [Citrobacter amalonaticus]
MVRSKGVGAKISPLVFNPQSMDRFHLAILTYYVYAGGSGSMANPARLEFFARKYQVCLTLWDQQHAVNQLM